MSPPTRFAQPEHSLPSWQRYAIILIYKSHHSFPIALISQSSAIPSDGSVPRQTTENRIQRRKQKNKTQIIIHHKFRSLSLGTPLDLIRLPVKSDAKYDFAITLPSPSSWRVLPRTGTRSHAGCRWWAMAATGNFSPLDLVRKFFDANPLGTTVVVGRPSSLQNI